MERQKEDILARFKLSLSVGDGEGATGHEFLCSPSIMCHSEEAIYGPPNWKQRWAASLRMRRPFSFLSMISYQIGEGFQLSLKNSQMRDLRKHLGNVLHLTDVSTPSKLTQWLEFLPLYLTRCTV